MPIKTFRLAVVADLKQLVALFGGTRYNKERNSYMQNRTNIITDEHGNMTKDLTDKLDWSLLPWAALEPVVRVLEYGAVKYYRDSWKKNDPEIYERALLRHVAAWQKGEWLDLETNQPHVAHIVSNALFLLYKK